MADDRVGDRLGQVLPTPDPKESLMGKSLRIQGAVVALCASLLASSPARAEDRPAEKILAEIKDLPLPTLPDDLSNVAAVKQYKSKYPVIRDRRVELIGELFKVNPDQPELTTLLPERWTTLVVRPAAAATLKGEVESVLARSKDEKLIAKADHILALQSLQAVGPSGKLGDFLPIIDAYAAKYPTDEQVPHMLIFAAGRIRDPAEKEMIYQRVEKDYKSNRMAARFVANNIRARDEAQRSRLARVGKPFELEFTDAIKGTKVTMASLRGKVVVIDFWATWCEPCINEMPKMKGLYAKYKDKGVEFIGVSLDLPEAEGGLDKLKEYVAKNDIQWPQYYQGNYWQSEFSTSWGVHSIPQVFLIDTDGNLASFDAKDKLESLLPDYLEKDKKRDR
jgi:thiol-disulfide isomerase/thioredoxin